MQQGNNSIQFNYNSKWMDLPVMLRWNCSKRCYGALGVCCKLLLVSIWMQNDCNLLSLWQYSGDFIKILVKSPMEEDFFEKLLTLYFQMFITKMDCSLFSYGNCYYDIRKIFILTNETKFSLINVLCVWKRVCFLSNPFWTFH